LFTVRKSPVNYLIVNGKIKIRGKQLDFDENKHTREHNRIAQDMLEKATKNSGINFLRE
jgi:hypothetical protein